MMSHNGILIVAEHYKGAIQKASFELVGRGKYLADKIGAAVSAVVFGGALNNIKELYAHGAGEVFHFVNEEFDAGREDQYIEAAANFIRDKKPEIVLFGDTYFSKSVAAGVASRLQTGLTADCTGLDINPAERLLYQTRPAFGGMLYATIVCAKTRPQMATVRPNTFKAPAPDRSKTGTPVLIKEGSGIISRIKTLEFYDNAALTKRLEEYDTLIGIGRGVNYAQCGGMVKRLADMLGAGICGTRAVVDAGVLDYQRQVGLSGKSVKPKLYFALGISGAIQHLTGVQSSETIVAINNDPAAPIFSVANIGIIAEVEYILPRIIEEFKYKL